jgi:inosose dehydratase
MPISKAGTTTPKLGVSPLPWTNDILKDLGGDIPVETCLADASAVGYEGVELGRKFPRDAAVLGPLLDRYGLALASGWHSGYLADRDVRAELAAVADHAALLKAMGATVMVYGECGRMAPGEPLDLPMSKRLRLHAGECDAYALRLMDFAERLAGEWGLTLAYHHHLMMVAETFDEISRILDRTKPALGVLLDTGHAQAAGFDYTRLIERYGDRIAHIHLKDVRADTMADVRRRDLSFNDGVRAGMFTVPGDGSVDFVPVGRFVRETGFKGWLIVEAEQDPLKASPKPSVTRALAVVQALL